MQRYMIWRIVQANILKIMIARFPRVLEHRRLENWHTDRAENSRSRLACMDKFRINMLEGLDQECSLLVVHPIAIHNC